MNDKKTPEPKCDDGSPLYPDIRDMYYSKKLKIEFDDSKDDDIRAVNYKGNLYWMPKMDMCRNIIVKREDLQWLFDLEARIDADELTPREYARLDGIKEEYKIE